MIAEAELEARSVRSLANSVLPIPLHGIAALQSDQPTAARLRAEAVLNPAAHGLTGQLVTALQVIVLTDPVVIAPVATDLTKERPKVLLAQKPGGHTDPVGIGRVLIAPIDPVVTAQVAIDLTDPVETALEVTGLTVLAMNDPLVTARIHQEPIIRLALNPDPPIVLAVTVPVVIDLIDPPVTDPLVTDPLVTAHIHQEPIVWLAQKLSVLID